MTGSTLRVKLWPVSAGEPGSWTLQTSDSTFDTGRAGIYLWASNGRDTAVDDFSVEGYSSSVLQFPDPGGGTVFSESFTGDDNDPWPNDWSHLGSPDPKIRSAAGAFPGNGTGSTSVLSGSYDNVSQVVRVVWGDQASTVWGLTVRHDGEDDGGQSGYYCQVTNGSTPTVAVVRYDTGTPTVVDDSEISPGTNVWVRCETEGTALRAKVWEQGEEEPAAWNIETTDSTYTSGQVGVYLEGSSNQAVYIDDYRADPTLPDVTIEYSASDDRSDPAGLDEATVAGNIYVFATDDPDVSEVSFWVDDPTMTGTADRVDTTAPYDLVGNTGTAADPYDTTSLADGAHTVTILVELADTTTFDVTAEFTVDNLPDTTIVYSASDDRSDPASLDEATVAGNIYVFATDDPDVSEVSFWVDDPTMTGTADRDDTTAPYDLVGNTGTAADPYDTTGITDGAHTVTILVELADTTTFDVTAEFTVDNASNVGDVSGVVFEDVAGNGVFDGGTDVGVEDVTVEVWDVSETTMLGSSDTESDGSYLIEDVTAGPVVVVVDDSVAPVDGVWSTPIVREVTVVKGEESDGVDFGWAYYLYPEERNNDISITVGYVGTLAGDGTDATVDGSASSASFTAIGGVTFAEGLIYVASEGAVRAVNEFTGAVTTLAGDATTTGCVNDTDGENVRFGDLAGAATDGVYVYVGDVDCDTVRRVHVVSGSTDHLAAMADVVDLVFAADGHLYAVTASKLFKVDVTSGAVTELATASTGFTALTADADLVWFVDGTNLDSLALTGGTVTTVASVGQVSAVESAGTYLYMAVDADGTELVRFDKATEELVTVAGSDTAGYADGSGVDVRIDGVTGIVTGGDDTLWLGDSGNHRVRTLGQDPFFSPGAEAFGWDGYGAWNGGLNAGLGSYLTDHTDLTVKTPGPALGLTRTYNSLDSFEGPFGIGWRFDYEMTWRRDSVGNVAVLYPDGRREVFLYENDEYITPDGYFSELEDDTNGGYLLTARDGTEYAIDENGQLTTITDLNANTLTLTYTNSQLTKVQDSASGRAITFTWTGNRITSASTDSVTAHSGPITWNYTYDTDGRLVSACDPRDNNTETGLCWEYVYGGGQTGDLVTEIYKPEGNLQAEIEYGVANELVAEMAVADNANLVSQITDGEGNTTTFQRYLGDAFGDETDFDNAQLWLPTSTSMGTLGRVLGASQWRCTPGVCGPSYSGGARAGEGVYQQAMWEPAPGETVCPATDTIAELDALRDCVFATSFQIKLRTPGFHHPANWAGLLGGLSTGGGCNTAENWNFQFGSYPTPRGNQRIRWSYACVGTGTLDGFPKVPVGSAYAGVFICKVGNQSIAAVGCDSTEYFDMVQQTTFPGGVVNPNQVRTVDGRGNATVQTFDEKFRLVEEEDALENVTSYGYDENGHRDEITDPNDNTVVLTFDGRGNRTSETNGEGETVYMVYNGSDMMVERRDGRSSGPSDDSFLWEYTYDEAKNRTSETDPLGHTSTWVYTDGSESADYGSGLLPAGLLRTATTAQGNESGSTPADYTTTYLYDSAGDLRGIGHPSGLLEEFVYDEIGREISRTVTDSVAGTSATTTTSYDEAGNVLTVTGTEITNEVTNDTHQLRTTNVYDDNSNLASTTLEDVVGDDTDRVTTYTYDLNDRQVSVTDPDSGVLSRTYDEVGNVVTVTDQEGRVTETVYDEANNPVEVVLHGYTTPADTEQPRDITLSESTYDPAGRLLSTTDAEGRVTSYSYDDADRVVSVVLDDYENSDTSTRDVLLQAFVYDNAGNLVSETVGDGTANKRVTTHSYDNAGRQVTATVDPSGLSRTTTTTYDANNNPLTVTRAEDSRSETTSYIYDGSDRVVSETVENGTVDLVTTYAYDERGNLVAVVDPRGNVSGATPADHTTIFSYDEDNRLISTVSPPVNVVPGPGTDQATATTGYNTFGDQTHTEDPRGNVTVREYDNLGRVTTIVHPEYTQPGESTPIQPTEVMEYDQVGNLTERTSRRGETTTYQFDDLNRVTVQTDPLLTGKTSEGVVTYEYDDIGNRVRVTDQNGAVTETGYDMMDRPRTVTVIVRQPSGPPVEMTTSYDYDDLGNQTMVTDPEGDITTTDYNPASEVVSVTDPLDETTSYQWVLGHRVRVTDPLGRYTVTDYDPAGRKTELRAYNPSDQLLTTTGYGYDPAGNQTEMISPRGFEQGADPADHTTTWTYDPLNRLTTVETPVSDTETITTEYGYDLVGNVVLLVDGNGHSTFYTYNPWNLRETVVEPATTAHPLAADRTWTTTYDPGGLPIEETLPGGVSVARTFDELGRLVSEVGAGDGSASRSLGYDLVGNQTSVSHPTTSVGFVYDDRNLLVSQSGGAGTATFSYDDAGRLTTRVDPAGTTTFTWSDRSELDTVTDPVTGTTLTYTWDDASQLTGIGYGTSGWIRSFTYDDLGRLASDTLEDSTPAVSAGYAYAYDVDGNLVEKEIILPGNTDGGVHEYSYDNAGRLVSWTHDSTVVDYEWDDAGNRVKAGTDTWTYDQRNRLVTGPEGDYTWTPRGTLTEVDDGTTPVTYDFDPLGRLESVDSVAYTYDSLGRVTARGSDTFTYTGFSLDPNSDSAHTYSRTPGGRLIGISDGTTNLFVGADRHGDLTHLHNAAGTVTTTRVYDPFGDPLTTTGTFTPQVGYQGDWTDPQTGHVWMGARWYEPGSASFLSRDTVYGELVTPISLNRYTYAFANPNTYWDPDGHKTFMTDGHWYGDTTTPNKPKTTKTPDAEQQFLANAKKKTTTATQKTVETTVVQKARISLDPDLRDEMASFLGSRGVNLTGWDTATDRSRFNYYAWAILKNTGRTGLTQSQYASLPDQTWLNMWASQGDAALNDIYKAECNVICRNKTQINTAIIATAAGFLTGGAATAVAPAAWSAVAVGAVAGGAGGLGSSLTSQAIQGDFSLKQTIIDTTLGITGGAIAGRVTSALTGRGTNTIRVPDPYPQYLPSGAPNRGPAAWVNTVDDGGNLLTHSSSPGIHAEVNAQMTSPGSMMSRVWGWRGPTSSPMWSEIPVCSSCQAEIPSSLFPSNVLADPGPWGW